MTEEHNAAPLPEVEHSPEILAHELAARVDRGLHELGVPPRDARDWSWCNFVPDAVNYCAVQDGRERGYEVRAAKYQAQDIHLVAAGKPTLQDIPPPGWIWDEPQDPDVAAEVQKRINAYYDNPEIDLIYKTTFRHSFNIAEINSEPFLFDLSFSQFMGQDGTLTQGGDNASSGIPSDHPLAQQLLHNGFIPLNDENLRTYMRFLCTHSPEYLDHVTMEVFGRVSSLPFEMNDSELMGRIPPAYGDTGPTPRP